MFLLDDSEGEEDENPREVTALSTGTGVEESWDDDVFSDEEPDEESVAKHNSSIDSLITKDHFFLPAELHASGYRLPPNEFRIIQGQFDDVD